MNIVDILRSVFFFIDTIIYEFVGITYNLFIQIANTTIFTEDIIDLFASKVYALLGIFMLFKVSFSIMTYIVNPDEFADKNKGFSKLITNIIITLTLLILTPWIFSQAMDIQRIVLKDNLIEKIFTSSTTTGISTNTGEAIAYKTFSAFYHINHEEFSECEGIESDTENASGCMEALKLSDNKYKHYKSYLTSAYFNENMTYLKNNDLLNYERGQGNIFTKNGGYMMEYHPIVSTAVGVFMVWILIIFCFDVAVRSVKLGFLRVIAPIPIISRIDPKGKGMFDKWTKNCISTYLDLFLRLLAIFFAIFIIEQVFYMDFVDQSTGLPTDVNLFTKIFIIMGALLFAKQLPKLLSDLTGAKLDGKFTLNPLKKFEDEAFGGKTITGAAAGLMTRGIPGMIAGASNRHGLVGKLRGATGGLIRNGVPGMFSGAWAGFAHNKGFADVKKQQINRRHALRDAIADGSTWDQRAVARINQALGMDSRVDEIKVQKDNITRDEARISDSINEINRDQAAQKVIMENNKAIIDAQNAEEKRALDKIKNGEAGSLSLEYNRRQTHLENLKAQMSAYQQQSADVRLNAAQRTAAAEEATRLVGEIAAQTQADATWLNNDAMYSYIDSRGAVDPGMGADAALVNLIAATDELSRVHGVTMARSASARHSSAGRLRGVNSGIQTSFYEQDSQKAEFNRQLDDLKERKRQLAEEERVAQANLNAINNSTK